MALEQRPTVSPRLCELCERVVLYEVDVLCTETGVYYPRRDKNAPQKPLADEDCALCNYTLSILLSKEQLSEEQKQNASSSGAVCFPKPK